MWMLSLKDYCLDCNNLLHYKFPYIKIQRLSTKLWCKNCDKVTTYFEQELKIIFNQIIKDLSNYIKKLPIGKEELRKEYCKVQKLYLNIGEVKYQKRLDKLREEIFN